MNRDDRRKGGKRTGPMVAAGLLAVFLCGCISVPIGDNKKQDGPPETTTRLVGMEGKPEFHPDVQRDGDVVQLRLMVAGTFVEETTTTRTYKVQKQKLAVGVWPGLAGDPATPGMMLVGYPLALVVVCGCYNALLLGTPTLSGLLVEPFLPARDVHSLQRQLLDPKTMVTDCPFRQMALVGFSKFKQGSESVEKKSKSSRRTVAKSLPVQQIALWFDAEPKFWESSAQEKDTLVLRGVEAGRHEGKLYVKSVPAGHLYEKELKKMEWVPIDVAIPE